MQDFTIHIYQQLLEAFVSQGYTFLSFKDHLTSPTPGKSVMLRHDVDARKEHSLDFAQIQNKLGIRGTYYFRMVPASYDEAVIKQIYDLGHEVGYHYEDMDFAKGDPDKAIKLFEQHLQKLRKIVPIDTICMHGSPRSAYDNKDVWKKYNYQDFGIIGEPYFDINFDDVFYITDTGRMWDGHKVTVRDRVQSNTFNQSYHFTFEIIQAIEDGTFPEKVMMNFHPQRWTDNRFIWFQELLLQRMKNVVKRVLVSR